MSFVNKTKRLTISVFLLSLITLLLIPPLQVHASQPFPGKEVKKNNLKQFIEHGSYALERDGKITVSSNINTPLVPASINKLFTSLLAIRTLGLDFRFITEFYTDSGKNLYIKGFGDPFLVSEDIPAIMNTLKTKGITEIRAIYLDDTSFQLDAKTDGAGDSLNPYDVSCGGLVVNFNTINIQKDENGNLVSAEPQTPFLPIIKRLGSRLPPGTHRINISNEPHDIALLTGQLFRAFQKKAGIAGNGIIANKPAPKNATKIYTYLSAKTLRDLLADMLLYSNNFIANQLFLTIGAEVHGYPATWKKARAVMAQFISNDKIFAGSRLTIFEGSGLSRKNKVTAKAMLHLLDLFRPYSSVLPEVDGDLIKSGTLTGVYSYAGYLNMNGKFDSFVIILNQQKNTRDKVLQLLKSMR